jgi:hypothetical protein
VLGRPTLVILLLSLCSCLPGIILILLGIVLLILIIVLVLILILVQWGLSPQHSAHGAHCHDLPSCEEADMPGDELGKYLAEEGPEAEDEDYHWEEHL